MDNASKALIMAGAILIAVMLISLGVLLYNRAQDVSETAMGSVDALGNEAFNAQFMSYLGNDMKASTARQLANKIVASYFAGVDINFTTDSVCSIDKTNKTLISDISNSKTYDISAVYTSGIISSISIKENGKTVIE